MKAKNNCVGFFFAIVFIVAGITMISKNLVAAGVNSRTQSLSGFGGHLLILIGFIFLVVGYYGLSPYSKVRQFFEGSPIRKTGNRKRKYISKRSDK
jgi:hypothetical protein